MLWVRKLGDYWAVQLLVWHGTFSTSLMVWFLKCIIWQGSVQYLSVPPTVSLKESVVQSLMLLKKSMEVLVIE